MNNYEYRINQEAYGLHNDIYYPIKILDQKKKLDKGEVMYKIHWQNWSKRWDCWVYTDRLTPTLEGKKNVAITNNSEENTVQEDSSSPEKENKQKCIKIANIKASRRKETINEVESQAEIINKKSIRRKPEKREINNKPENKQNKKIKESEEERLELSITKDSVKLPLKFQSLLLQEYEFICHQRLLYPLPRKPCISDILYENLDNEDEIDKSVIEGIANYFNRSLNRVLLYSAEYNQYKEFDKLDPSSVYGAEHLLRLIIKLPTLLSTISFDSEEIQLLIKKIYKIVKYLDKNPSVFLPKDKLIKV